MKQTNKKRFTQFRKNKFLISKQIDSLLSEIKSKVIYHSYLVACPYVNEKNKYVVPQMFSWHFIKKNNKIIIQENEKKINEFEFKNNLLFLIRNSGLTMLTLNNYTNQNYTDNKTEIIELWGFKISLFYKWVLIETIKSNDLLKFCTFQGENEESVGPEPHIIYCGPDGRIFGWDLI